MSQICYTYSLKSGKNSTSNASLLKQLFKVTWKNSKNSRRVTFIADLQTSKRDRNIAENSSCWAKTSQTLRQKATDTPWEPKARELVQPPVFCLWRLESLMSMLSFASQGACKALYFMYSFLFQKYTTACTALEEYKSNLKCCCFHTSSPPSWLRRHVCYPVTVFKAAKQFQTHAVSSRAPCSSHRRECMRKHCGFVRSFFNYRKQSMSATKLR